MKNGFLPVTAILVSRNEAHLLPGALETLRKHCDELHVVDLESTDRSVDVAERYGALVTVYPLVPIADMVYPMAAKKARNDWILTTDPDERVPDRLLDELANLLPILEPDVGIVFVPLQFYFRGRRLRGTIWGGMNKRRLLVHRDRAEFLPHVHAGARLRPGFREIQVEPGDANVVQHLWSTGWHDLIHKHLRYLSVEGRSRFEHGQRTRWREVGVAPLQGFFDSFIRRKGYSDGLTGFVLSIFWATYLTAALLELRLHQWRAGGD